MKTELSPRQTWHGLPLSPAQNREVLNYVQRCRRDGVAWDTPELRCMLEDMLSPPELPDEARDELAACADDACFAATHEEPGDGFGDDPR